MPSALAVFKLMMSSIFVEILYWQFGRLITLENPTCVGASFVIGRKHGCTTLKVAPLPGGQ